MLRCCCCFALFLSTLFRYYTGESDCDHDTNQNFRLLLDCVVYAYASLLAISVVLLRFKWSKILSAHLEAILLSSLVIYGFDTVFPAIISAESWQSCEGNIQICVKLTALLLGAVLVPLLTPRYYVPADPKNPSMFPNPEQTASLLSLIFFSYLDSLVLKASKVPHLSTEALPPLSDNDQARILRDKNLSKIDPLLDGGKRHVFLNLLRVFLRDVAGMSVALICHSMASFLPAVSTNRLLVHLEKSGLGDGVPAWVWITLLFVGPVASSSAIEWYMRVILKAFVRTEALLTQLIFAHAVRARVKADVRDSGTNDRSYISPSAFAEKASGSTADINTLITVDLNTMNQGLHFLVLVVYLPIQFIFCIVFLYKLLGWSAFVGIGLTLALSSIPGIVGKSLHSVQEDKMKKTDSRVRFFTDVVNVLRMVKLFGWEEKMSQRITQKRIIELKASQKARLIELLLIIISFVLPFTTMLVTFACYPSVAFPALVVFENFRNQIQVAFVRGTECITAKVSLDRINKFLQNTELLDAFVVTGVAPNDSEELTDKIGFSNASFTWSNHTGGNAMPSGRRFILSVPGTLYFKRNALNLITGPVGSGKTSLLLALLGELNPTGSWFNLPRAGGMAYAAQESWVLNETIRENILFGFPYNEERYKKVIKQCALEQDLALFAAGDQTEIGEKGLSVSGGQKARLTLARAIYSQAEILILDDILAALDVHTSKWIVEECLSGDLVKGRTVIMVVSTMATSCLSTASDNIDGYIEFSRDVLEQAAEEELDPQVDVKNENNTANSKLIVSEEIQEGNHVGRAAIALYISGLGGKHPVLFFTFFFACLFTAHFIGVVQTWFLSYWAEQYASHAPTQVSAPYYLGIYGLIFLIYVAILSSAHAGFIVASVKASESIHNQLVESILAATFRWLDETPTSRIITRATQDIGSVCDFSILLLFKIGALVVFTPMFIIPSAILAGLGIWVGSVYLNAQSSVKREMSIAKAPVVGLIGAASTGIISVRAYSAQNKFADLLIKRIDHYSRSAIVFYGLQRWMAMRTETLAGLFCAGLAGYLVYCTDSSASDIGFLLNLAVDFSSGMVWWVISRIESYLRISHEAHLGDGSLPPAHWPSSGELRVENLTARYSLDGPQVLRGLSFQIKSGERIGVVGRTGSGKSTLTLALLRCILTEGSVFYDGMLTSALNLDALRSQITIIPQTPELISGSLRQNLDPFEEHDDLTLNHALKSAGLDTLQEELNVQDRVNLETLISDGGKNLSVGQRQIIALARAIIRRSKLLILDEDYKTDTIIQNSLRTEYKERGGDATIITIAHRLQTVLDADRIMILDAGRIVEFDSPQTLLQKEGGQFRAMIEEAHDKDVLLAMVDEGSSVM
ncbi:hypothetical protein BDP27DRAFT_1380610 [Rhodocollybia butyracea]|uniref:P-loop containing nucleoside triphosphate hydrolase protein n=1 Tax=Rhodocollybia butyracea TaxID=206335 RepID=A0A9P5UE91_9AGAR|nr:hypothetical protein BDP27DRAFT_1380610 [Rhodocollybia butyracea]